MRKAFKVATVFTGAAACAAAFAPAAEAATTARTQLIEPATSHRNCAGGTTTSTVLFRPTSADHGPTCVGGANNYDSPTYLGGTYFTYFCAGNNYGSIFYTPTKPTRYYGPGSGIGTLDHGVSSVNIYAWSSPAAHRCNT